jgi:hypothetical protein
MLCKKTFYFILFSHILAGGTLTKDDIQRAVPKNAHEFYVYIIIELKTAGELFQEAYFQKEREFFKNTKDESLRLIFRSITAYTNGILDMAKTYKEKDFPYSDYISNIWDEPAKKRKLAPILYKDLCKIGKIVNIIKFNVKLGRNDLEMLVIKQEKDEFHYIRNFKRLANAARSILVLIEKFEKVFHEELTILAETMRKRHDPLISDFCLDINFKSEEVVD